MQNSSLLLLTFSALAIALLVLAVGTAYFILRARRARRTLATAIHDRALALDQRCDVLQGQIGTLGEQLRLAYLFELISCAESENRLSRVAARKLRRHALDLRARGAGLK